jgi:hypothetical protein
MPRRNRVTPFGEVVAVPERGTLMGNRGVLHDAGGRVVRPWQSRRWLLCRLEFRERHRQVMAPGRYTELFFLDEATALAAGHRPCAECQRTRFLAFRDAWAAGDGCGDEPGTIRAATIDDRLQDDRVEPDRTRRTFRADIAGLPDGVVVTPDGRGGDACLIREGELLAWSPGGYRDRRPRPDGGMVTVLTPRSTVRAIRAGYVPEVHPTALDGSTTSPEVISPRRGP